MIKLITSLLITSLAGTLSFAQGSLFDQQMQIGFEQKQGQYVDPDTRLINENGDTVTLRDIIKRPVLLNLVYFECPGVCSPIMSGIARFIDATDLKLGEDYDVLTISFDSYESIQLGIAKKTSYLATMTKKEEAAKYWHFFVSDSLNISRLTESAGFNFKQFNNQFIHPAGLIALASDGMITRYLNGIEFLPFDIKITLVEAADGKIGPSINRLLAVCYSYDSSRNQFVFNVTKVSAILITFMALILFLILAFPRIKSKISGNK